LKSIDSVGDTLSVTIRVYIHSFSTVVACQICEIPRNSQKIRTYRSSRSSNWL